MVYWNAVSLASEKQRKNNVSVTVELPSGVADRYGVSPEQIGRHLLEQAAIEGYRSGELSRGQVAQMLYLDWEDTEELLAKHQCDRHHELDDLEQDRKSIGSIFGPS
jgi:predicted HTH domain antitoxin